LQQKALAMKSSTSILIGLFAAPLLPAIYLNIFYPMTSEPLMMLGWIIVVYQPVLLVCAALGLPAYLIGRRLNLVRWWSALLVGALIGAAFGNFQINCPLGAATAILFWLIVRLGNTGAPVEYSSKPEQ
jgi:hypothetical protein